MGALGSSLLASLGLEHTTKIKVMDELLHPGVALDSCPCCNSCSDNEDLSDEGCSSMGSFNGGSPSCMSPCSSSMSMSTSSSSQSLSFRRDESVTLHPLACGHKAEQNNSLESELQSTWKLYKLKLIQGSVIVFICPGYSGKRFVYEKAHSLGIQSIVLDQPGSWAQGMMIDGIISEYIPINFDDEPEVVFQRCMEVMARVQHKYGRLDGCTTFCDMALPLAARLAAAMDLPGNPVSAVEASRDKYLTRTAMAKAGLPTPRYASISAALDVVPAGEHVGFPAVIKPVAGSASFGVMRVNSMSELAAAYTRLQAELSTAKVVGGSLFEGGEAEQDQSSAQNNSKALCWMAASCILEEYLDGPEVDCDLVLYQGKPVYASITDNWPTLEPYFNETGSNCPSLLPKYQQRELLEISIDSVQALGFTTGVFHVEAKYTSRGPRLIEINSRMGGGPVRDTNLLVWSVDLIEQHLLCVVGLHPSPAALTQPKHQIAEYSVNAHKTGLLRDTDYLEQWIKHPDVLYARPLVEAGGKVVCVDDGLPTWVCEVMVVKPTVTEAIQFVEQVTKALDIQIH